MLFQSVFSIVVSVGGGAKVAFVTTVSVVLKPYNV